MAYDTTLKMVRWVHKVAKMTVSKSKSVKDTNHDIGNFESKAIKKFTSSQAGYYFLQPSRRWPENYKFLNDNNQFESLCNSQELLGNRYVYASSSGVTYHIGGINLVTPTALSVAVGAGFAGGTLIGGTVGCTVAAGILGPTSLYGSSASNARLSMNAISASYLFQKHNDSLDIVKAKLEDLKIDVSKFISKNFTFIDDVKKLIKNKNAKVDAARQDTDINEFPIIDINTFSSLLTEESYTMPSGLTREQKLEWLSENQKKIQNMK